MNALASPARTAWVDIGPSDAVPARGARRKVLRIWREAERYAQYLELPLQIQKAIPKAAAQRFQHDGRVI